MIWLGFTVINFILFWPMRWLFHDSSRRERRGYDRYEPIQPVKIKTLVYGLFFSALWIVIPLGLLVAIFMWLAVYTNDWEALSRFMERPLFKKEG